MNATMVVLRLLHIGAGVFWAGTVLFVGFMLEPSVRAAGPAGGQVMQQLQLRKYAIVMPTAALVAILSGFELLRRSYPGGPAAWIATRSGVTFLVGGTAALITLLMGITFVLPLVKRMGALAAQMGASGSVPDPSVAAQLVVVRGSLTRYTRIATALVIITVVCMAVARYV